MLVGTTASLVFGGAQGLGSALKACLSSLAFSAGSTDRVLAASIRTQLESSAV
jgi:hypothetical protein